MWTLGCPGEQELPKMTKAEAKASVDDMGAFADWYEEHEKKYVWCETKREFVEREQ